jgi:hypothetical protein
VRAQELSLSAANAESASCTATPKGGGSVSISLLAEGGWERVWSATEETAVATGMAFEFKERHIVAVRLDASNDGSQWEGCSKLLMSFGVGGTGL